MKIGIADYGMFVWYGAHFDYEERIAMAKELGYLGLERLYPTSAEDALRKAAWLKRNGTCVFLHFDFRMVYGL